MGSAYSKPRQQHQKQYKKLLSKRTPVCVSPFEQLDYWDRNIGTYFKWSMRFACTLGILWGAFNMVQINISSTKFQSIATTVNEIGSGLAIIFILWIGFLSYKVARRPTAEGTYMEAGLNLLNGAYIGILGGFAFGFMIWVVTNSTATTNRKFIYLLLAIIAIIAVLLLTEVKNKQFGKLIVTMNGACNFYRPILSDEGTLLFGATKKDTCKGRQRVL